MLDERTARYERYHFDPPPASAADAERLEQEVGNLEDDVAYWQDRFDEIQEELEEYQRAAFVGGLLVGGFMVLVLAFVWWVTT